MQIIQSFFFIILSLITYHVPSAIIEIYVFQVSYCGYRGKSVTSKIECKSDIYDLIGKTMDMESMIKD